MTKQRIVVGITGASGVIYGIRLLEVLQSSGLETHLVLSEAASQNLGYETTYSVEQVLDLADVVYDNQNLAGAIASGSFLTAGMVVIPCTIKTLSSIAHSYNDNLMTRAADVTLKEQRRLVLVVRETPLHKGHIRLMAEAADMGAIILPPIPAFYHQPATVMDIVDQSVGKVLDCMGIEHSLFRRWGENREKVMK